MTAIDCQANGSALRQLLEDTAAEEGLSMKDLTVLAVQNDPFRIDTPAGHRGVDGLPLLDSEWAFADQCRALIDSKAYRNGGAA